MINARAQFKRIGNTWRLVSFMNASVPNPKHEVINMGDGSLVIWGRFTHKPKLGFCKRPHKLMEFGVNHD